MNITIISNEQATRGWMDNIVYGLIDASEWCTDSVEIAIHPDDVTKAIEFVRTQYGKVASLFGMVSFAILPVVKETEKARLIDFGGDSPQWLPKSQTILVGDRLYLPLWLARKCGIAFTHTWGSPSYTR